MILYLQDALYRIYIREVEHRIGAGLMQKAFKYRLYPNKATEKKLYFVLNHCSYEDVGIDLGVTHLAALSK